MGYNPGKIHEPDEEKKPKLLRGWLRFEPAWDAGVDTPYLMNFNPLPVLFF